MTADDARTDDTRTDDTRTDEDVTDDRSEGVRQYRFAPPPGATTITLVRHGETMPEHPDRPFPLLDGQGDPDLAPDGREQARRVSERLIEEEKLRLPGERPGHWPGHVAEQAAPARRVRTGRRTTASGTS